MDDGVVQSGSDVILVTQPPHHRQNDQPRSRMTEKVKAQIRNGPHRA